MCRHLKIVRKRKMLTVERKNEIMQRIEEIILNNKELAEPAFDIVKFLKEKESFAIASKPMADDTTGMLFVDDEEYILDTDTHKLIVVNSLLKEQPNFVQRRRFIIAHEYAHYVLHKHNTKQYAHRDTSQKESNEEIEADFFARCLLMPQKVIDAVLDLNFVKELSVENKIALIARFFNVTKKKAKQRLEEDLCYNV